MKAMLLRHILLKKAGQLGFITKCSSKILSSVNKVLTEQNHKNHINTENNNNWLRINTTFIIRLKTTELITGSNYSFLWK